MITVVAAVIVQEQKVLVCQRKADAPHALKWEFPGGKVEVGESLEGALKRELEEEMGILPQEFREIARSEFAYPGKAAIQLVFFQVDRYEGRLQNRIFEKIEWSDLNRLPSYDFLEGDVDFVNSLASMEYRSKMGRSGFDSASS